MNKVAEFYTAKELSEFVDRLQADYQRTGDDRQWVGGLRFYLAKVDQALDVLRDSPTGSRRGLMGAFKRAANVEYRRANIEAHLDLRRRLAAELQHAGADEIDLREGADEIDLREGADEIDLRRSTYARLAAHRW
jgi:hypothetical protein